jgi:hypothetical protein
VHNLAHVFTLFVTKKCAPGRKHKVVSIIYQEKKIQILLQSVLRNYKSVVNNNLWLRQSRGYKIYCCRLSRASHITKYTSPLYIHTRACQAIQLCSQVHSFSVFHFQIFFFNILDGFFFGLKKVQLLIQLFQLLNNER